MNSTKSKGSEFTINLLDGDTKTVFADVSFHSFFKVNLSVSMSVSLLDVA